MNNQLRDKPHCSIFEPAKFCQIFNQVPKHILNQHPSASGQGPWEVGAARLGTSRKLGL
jgi:hypothetical protein